LAERSTEPTRRLTAIMFTDMVAYTALVETDERQALALRDRWRDVLERQIARYAGTLLQTYGDGSLSIFDSAIAAVECAVAIQRDLQAEPQVPLRIGIHTGDIVHDAQGVFGDGVNVASRIQSLAAPGSVLVSAKVADDLKNQRGLAAESLGEFDLKNVRRPMEIFAVIADGVPRPERRNLAAARVQTERRSVAVLPFANLSIDPENEVFSDGITEELINALTRVNGLQVTARTSSFAFKGRQEDVREIASTLGVTAVLEGSVRKDGERVRITAQLIDARNGYHLFSETYDRQIADIFQTQDEIARAIVRAVHQRLAPEDRQEHLVTTRADSAAHAIYLKGLREFNRWAPDSQRAAIAYFQKAIRLDPAYAAAHRGLARAHLALASYGQADPSSAYAEAESAAKRAAELDPNDGEAHATLGLVRLFADWDLESAHTECQKALSMSPGSAGVRHAWAMLLQASGEAAKAVEEMEAAVQLDPLSALMQSELGNAMFAAGRFDEAHRALDHALEVDPGFRAALEAKGWIFILQRRFAEAAGLFDRILELTGDPYKTLSSRGFVAARLGRSIETRRSLEMLQERQRRNPHLHLEVDFLLLHYALGEMETAAQYFEALVRKGAATALFMATNPTWRVLRAQPEFRAALERRGYVRGTLDELRARRRREPPSPSTPVASPPAPARAMGMAAALQAVPAATVEPEHLFGIFRTLERSGRWTPARHTTATVILGGGTLDLREAQLQSDVTEIELYVILGGLEIIVPPNVRVDWSGTTIAGAHVQGTPPPEPPPPGGPVLALSGLIVVGAVTTHVRHIGESEDAANRRAPPA
jgi:TolB-like protein/class 3 adenylate cyclase/Tfp pilus assembly protein PilF